MQPTSWDAIEAERLSERITRQMVNGEQATVARFRLAKGAFVPRHAHVNEQFSYVLEGALRLTFDAGPVVARAGQIVVIPPNAAHQAEALEDCLVVDFFAPRREDWLRKEDAYLRT